jgi:hypothetical protein
LIKHRQEIFSIRGGTRAVRAARPYAGELPVAYVVKPGESAAGRVVRLDRQDS